MSSAKGDQHNGEQAAWVLLWAAAFYGTAQVGWPVGALVVVLGWLGICMWWPWALCSKCHGNPKNFDSSGKHFNKYCRRCGTTGERLRWVPAVTGIGRGL